MKTQKVVSNPFLLLYGNKWVGKSSILKNYVGDLLGYNVNSDFLKIEDFGDRLWKVHTLKVEYKKWEFSDSLAREYAYEDRWAREIKEWMSRSPVGDFKVVLIENIERMNSSSANALLKLIEEPWEGRLIVATTNSLESIMDTIKSRALLVACNNVSVSEVKSFLLEKISTLDPKDAETIAILSNGRVGFAYTMALSLWKSEDDETKTLLDRWNEYKTLGKEGFNNKIKLSKLFVDLNKQGMIQDFLNLLHYDIVNTQDFYINEQIVKIKKYIASNVNIDAAMFGLVNELVGS